MADSQETFRMILSGEDRASSVFSAVGLSLTAALAGAAFFSKGVVEMASRLQDLSNQTGISSQTLSGIKVVLEQNGTSAEAFAKGIYMAQKNLGQMKDTVKSAAESIGLDFDKLVAASPNEFLEMLAGALGRIEDPMRRNAMGAALMGRSFKELGPALSAIAGHLDELKAKGISEQDIKKLKEVDDAWIRIKNTLEITVAGPLATYLEAMGKLTGLMDLSRVESLGKAEMQVEKFSATVARSLGMTKEAVEKSGIPELIAQAQKVPGGLGAPIQALEHWRQEIEKFKEPTTAGVIGAPVEETAQEKTVKRITTALNVMRQRTQELVMSGLKPTTEELQEMFKTVAVGENLGFRTFGLMFPDALQKDFTLTKQLLNELAKLSDIDPKEMLKALPKTLGDEASFTIDAQAIKKVFDPIKNSWMIINSQADETRTKAGEVADELGGWNTKLQSFEAETKKLDLPTTLENWKKGAEGYGVAINTVTGAQVGLNMQLRETILLTDELNKKRAGSPASSGKNLDQSLEENRLTTNQSKY